MNQLFSNLLLSILVNMCSPSSPVVVCVTDNCQQNKRCCRNPSRRSPRWTSVCRWRTRSSSGSSTMETWAALAERPLHLPPPLMPSASNHPAALASSPAPLCLPNNPRLLLPVSGPLLRSSPPALTSQVCFPFYFPQDLMNSLFAYGMGEGNGCTDALVKHGRLVLCLSSLLAQMRKRRISGLYRNEWKLFVSFIYWQRCICNSGVLMYHMWLKYSYFTPMLGLHSFSVQLCPVTLAKSRSSPVYLIWNVLEIWDHLSLFQGDTWRSLSCLHGASFYCMFNFSVPFLKGFKLKVFLFHMLCFHGTNPVRVVDQLVDLPNAALKSRLFAKPEALQYLYVRRSLLEASPRRWICLELVLLVFWPR